MPLTLRYTAQTSLPVEIEGLLPERACGWSLAEIERFEILHGNRKLPLADLFDVSGDPGDLRFDFEGDLSGVHWIGAHMTEGAIHVHGSAGRHVGEEMRGGEIHVEGDAGDWLGGALRGGLLRVQGDAGHHVGAAHRGAKRGMTGGAILIAGGAGDEVGRAMRRGLIAVGGAAGDALAFHMLAGTVLVFGSCGLRPAAGMKRGTVGLFGDGPPELLPTFRRACTYRPQVLPLIFRQLRAQGFAVADELFHADYDLYNGDFLALGKGEVLLRR